MSYRPRNTFCGQTRREFLWQSGGAFTSVALTGLLSLDGFLTGQAKAADGVTRLANQLGNRIWNSRSVAYTAKAKRSGVKLGVGTRIWDIQECTRVNRPQEFFGFGFLRDNG